MKRKFRLIIIAFSASFLVMAGLSFYSMKQFETLTQFSEQIDHTYQVINKLHIIESTVKELDIKERGFMITRDSIFLVDMETALTSVEPALTSLKDYVGDNKKQLVALTQLRATLQLRILNINTNLSYLHTDTTRGTTPYFNEGKRLKRECMGFINSMKGTEENLLKERTENKVIYQRITSNTIRYLLFIFCIVTATLFLVMINELKKRLESQDELQNKIIDVKRSHSELEQIAYASSHDLQEPLRKIQVFTDRFAWLHRDKMDEETEETFKRINAAATRMQELIEDLANLTTLTKDKETKEDTDLNRILNSAIADLNIKITEKDATIYKEVLPEVNGHPHQLHILFKSLLDNSLKFSRDDVKPLISIRSDKVNGDELIEINPKLAEKSFYRITIADNGIGFDNKFIGKMFQIFQRLHNQQSEYEGKGVGLAICQRVMANHEGYIIAHGHTEVGATFKMFFPANGS
jgi:signal transduction histidine kinase